MFVSFVTLSFNMLLNFNSARSQNFRDKGSCTWTRVGCKTGFLGQKKIYGLFLRYAPFVFNGPLCFGKLRNKFFIHQKPLERAFDRCAWWFLSFHFFSSLIVATSLLSISGDIPYLSNENRHYPPDVDDTQWQFTCILHSGVLKQQCVLLSKIHCYTYVSL